MSFTFYRVVFKGKAKESVKKLSLTFKNASFSKFLNIPSQIIIGLKKLSKTNQNVVVFQNIEEVTTSSKNISLQNYNYYFVILFIKKTSSVKEGYLIGNQKKIGDVLIGIYPFNEETSELSTDKILEKLMDLTTNPNDYTDICLIN